MAIRDYMHERAEESRHDEMSAYLMFIAGSVLFVGGVLETLHAADSVHWLLLIPVGFSSSPGSILGLALTLSGLGLIIFGLVAGIYFARSRSWYLRELRQANSIQKGKRRKRKQTTTREPWIEKKRV